MDTKLKNNKKSEEFKEKSKVLNKSKGVIATLLMIITIVIAALVMCNSYGFIDETAKSKKINYFNQYEFADIIVHSSYALYYDSINNNQKPSEVLLDIEKNLNVNLDEANTYEDGDLNDYLRNFNDNFSQWSDNINHGNLNYYYYNISNNKTNSKLNGNIKFEDSNIDLSQLNKNEYQFYAIIKFDTEGNIDITECIGADSQSLKEKIKAQVFNIREEYNTSYSDESSNYSISINPIKDIVFVYAVPKVLNNYDNISWGIENSDIWAYNEMGAIIAFTIAGVISLIALIFSIKRAMNTVLFNKISKIPFEIWIIIIGFAIAVLGPISGQLIKTTLNGDLQLISTGIIPNLVVPETIIWLFNFAIWLVSYSAVFFFVLIIKYIFNIGIINYIKRRTIFGRLMMFFIRYIKKTLDAVTSVDLEDKNNKLIIKLVIINAIILLLITSIWFFGIPVIILYSVILFFIIRKYVDKISEKYSKLREATSKIAQGNLDVKIEEDLGLFEPFKTDLEKIQGGFKKAVDEEVKSQKMKTDLITNVSHDLKTPLTAIITYADLLKDENISEEKRMQYIEILDKKAQRLQALIEDLFEMSKASSGNITLNIENVDVVSLMKQTLLELEDKFEESNLIVRKNLPEEKIILSLDSQRTFRVFENLLINITKYAMPNTRVFIDIIENNDNVEIIMKNMAAEEIKFNVETIAERFVRGDESRNTEGSGLGLAIAKSFTELQGGNFNISVDGDLFKVTIVFIK